MMAHNEHAAKKKEDALQTESNPCKQNTNIENKKAKIAKKKIGAAECWFPLQ